MYKLTFTKKDGTTFEHDVSNYTIQNVSDPNIPGVYFAVEIFPVEGDPAMVPLVEEIKSMTFELIQNKT